MDIGQLYTLLAHHTAAVGEKISKLSIFVYKNVLTNDQLLEHFRLYTLCRLHSKM